MRLLSVICAMLAIFSSKTYTVSDKDWQETTKIVYNHSDPTVSPEYHRSCRVTVTEEEVIVEVSAYSKTLLIKHYPNTVRNYKSLIVQMSKMGVRKVKVVNESDAGGESEALLLYKGEKQYFSAYRTSNGGNLSLENDNLDSLIHKLLPNLDKMIEQTRAN